MNREQFLSLWRYLLQRGMKDAADTVRRNYNRQVLQQYQRRSKVSLVMAQMAEEVKVEGGLRKYYPEMEG